MRQFIDPGSPQMGSPLSSLGGAAIQGMGLYRQQQEQARMQAMIKALQPQPMPTPLAPAAAGGVGAMSMPAEGMGAAGFAGMPPIY